MVPGEPSAEASVESSVGSPTPPRPAGPAPDLTSFSSRLARSWSAGGNVEPWRELDGSAVLADLSGFTRLTEVLAARGPEGSEVLHRALTLCFATLLGPSVDLGGDIIGFAGDSAFVWFDGDDHQARALQAAAAMPPALARLPAAMTGGKRLRVSIGVNSGPVVALVAGRSQRGLFLCGPTVSTLVDLQSTAGPGQVLVGERIAAALPEGRLGASLGSGRELLGRGMAPQRGPLAPAAALRGGAPEPPAAPGPTAHPMIAPSVAEVLAAGVTSGEHRDASIGFIAVPGVESLLSAGGLRAVHDMLEHVVDTVCQVADELSVVWLDTDVGAHSVKLLLSAGVPQATDRDERRLLLALRRILDRCDVPLRAGAQRGRVFAGPLGVPERMSYTIIGDAANVAARALGFAGDRELVAGDGLDVAAASVSATSLGPIALKNRARPAELWKVSAVDPLDTVRRRNALAIGTVRDAEWRAVRELWKHAVDEARGCVVELTGEPGMGGSEILAELVEFAGPDASCRVAGDPARQRQPFDAVAAIADQLAARTPENPAAKDGWRLLESAIPQLPVDIRSWAADAISVACGADPRPGLDPLTTARRTRRVLAELLLGVAPRPWLLAIDDADRIDDASLSLLGELRDRAADHALVLVTASVEPPFPDPFEATIPFGLEPLSRQAAGELALDLDPTLRDDEIDRLAEASVGNPFILAELIGHPTTGALPDSLARLATELVDGLPAADRALVRDASCFGGRFSLDTVAAVLDRPDLAEPNAWARTTRVLRQAGAGHLAFRQDAYREAAHQSLSFRRRRSIHGAIAESLIRSDPAAEATIAGHLEEAGRLADAFPLTCSAGRSARDAGAMGEAADLLRRASKMARTIDRRALGPLLVEYVQVLIWIGDLVGARRELEAARRVVDDPLLYAELCHLRADIEIAAGALATARRWVHKGLSIARAFGDQAAEIRAKLLLDEAAVLVFSGRNVAAVPVAEEALAIAVQISSSYVEGDAHNHLEMAYSGLGDQSAAVVHGEAAIAIYRATGRDRHLVDAMINTGLTALYTARWEHAARMYDGAIEACARLGNTRALAVARMNKGFLRFRQGHLAEAESLQRAAQRTTDSLGMEIAGATCRFLASKLATAHGDFVEAGRLLDEARATYVKVGDQQMITDCDGAAMENLVAGGRADQALDLYATRRAAFAGADRSVAIAARCTAGVAMAQCGDAPGGMAEVAAAAETARLADLEYEEYLCLLAAVAIEDRSGVDAPAGSRAAISRIADTLHIERSPS